MAVTQEKKPQTKPVAARLKEAVELPRGAWDDARRLARQLKDKPILPLIGAGASFDCGMEVAKPVAKRMFKWYVDHNGTAPHPSDLDREQGNLGVVADAIYSAGSQSQVIEALGLANRSDWPDAEDLKDHFCSYRLLARLAREGLIAEAITLNYDCCFERGLEDEGFLFSPWELQGRAWLDHATVVTDGTDHVQLDPRGQLVVTKAHGCAAGFRRTANEVKESVASPELRERMERARTR